MLIQLITHSWRKFWRSPAFKQEILQTIFLGFLGLYFCLAFFGLAVASGKMIEEFFPDKDLLVVSGRFVFWYFILDLIVRQMMQKFPTLEIQPYMTLPVKRKSIVNFLLLKSVTNYFNWLPLFFVLPFYAIHLSDSYPINTQINFLGVCFGMLILNNYLSFGMAKAMTTEKKWPFVFLGSLVLLYYLDYEGYIAVSPWLEKAFAWLITDSATAVIPAISALGVIIWLHSYMRANLTLESDQIASNARSFRFGWLDQFGNVGNIIDLELKVMMRSKRARSQVIIGAILIFYPVLIFNRMLEDPNAYLFLMLGIFATGGIAMNHGQLMLSWNSQHFDLLMSRGFTIREIFKAKYLVLAGACFISYLISIFYVFISPKLFLYITVMFLFNISVIIFMYMLIASKNSKRIDLMKGSAFNYEGLGAAQWLIVFPLLGIPALLFFLGDIIGGESVGLGILAGIGLLGTVFHNKLIDACANIFLKNKYKVAAAFRKKN